MIPFIIVSTDQTKIDQYLDKFAAVHAIVPSNIIRIRPEKKEISIQQVREIKKELTVAHSDQRLYIFYDFDLSSVEAQNALLKTLEEQIATNQFMLVCSNQYSILPTILSRARVIKLPKTLNRTEETEKRSKIEKFLDNLSVSKNLSFLASPLVSGQKKEELDLLLEAIIDHYRARLAESAVSSEILKKALKYGQLIQIYNIHPQLAIDDLLIFIWEKYNIK